eukprot:gene13028-17460_t
MGGFEFGLVGKLDPDTALISFVAVIAFIIIFDFLVELMEYFVKGSHLYDKMVQMIYKELMLMGLVSFTVIMYVAEENGHQDWIQAIDFSHITLFYMTFFFVYNAFYLMRVSILSSSVYRKMFCEKTENLIKSVKMLEDEPTKKFLFSFNYLPLSNIRERVEFTLAHSLFKATYWLPDEFEFHRYLSGCLERYALKTINRSTFTWIILIVLLILNFGRIKIGFNCKENRGHDIIGVNRRLGGGATTEKKTYYDLHVEKCETGNLKYFIFCEVVLFLYTFCVVLATRVYKLRLIDRIGFKSSTEYIDYLKFMEQYEKEEIEKRKEKARKKMIHNLLQTATGNKPTNDQGLDDDTDWKITTKQLRKDIEHVLDEDERGNDDDEEEIYRFIGEFLRTAISTFSEEISLLFLNFRIWVLSILKPSRVNKEDNVSLLSLGGLANVESIDLNGVQTSASNDIELSSNINSHKNSFAVGDENVQHRQSRSPRISILKKLSQRSSSTLISNQHVNKSLTNNNQDNPADNRFSFDGSLKSSNIRLGTRVRLTPESRPSLFLSPQIPNIRPPFDQRQSSIASVGADPTSSINSDNNSLRGSSEKISTSNNINESSKNRRTSRRSITVNDLVKTVENNRRTAHRGSVIMPSKFKHEESFNSNVNLKGNQGHMGSIAEISSRQSSRTSIKNTVSIQPPEGAYNIVESFRRSRPHIYKQILKEKKKREEFYSKGILNSFKEFFRNVSNYTSLSSLSLDSNSVLPMNSNIDDHTGMDSTVDFSLSEDFSDIFLFAQPVWYFRSVEVCIMLNCLYLAIWMTNFSIIAAELDLSPFWKVASQLIMILPLFVITPAIGSIAKTCALLTAISQLNLEVIHSVLVEMEESKVLVRELRAKMLNTINMTIAASPELNLTQKEIVYQLFSEIDQDGSGRIDKAEFRTLLRKLKLTYSDRKFKLLYQAVDINGDGNIGRSELNDLLFPPENDLLSEFQNKSHEEKSDESDESDNDEAGLVQPEDVHSSHSSNNNNKHLPVIRSRARTMSQEDEKSDKIVDSLSDSIVKSDNSITHIHYHHENHHETIPPEYYDSVSEDSNDDSVSRHHRGEHRHHHH